MGSTQDQFEIIAPFCMYTMGVFFPSPRIYKESFWYYKLGPGQLHPNGWLILSTFNKFLKFIKIKSISFRLVII